MYLARIAKIEEVLKDEETAHLVIDNNRVTSENLVTGLEVEYEEFEKGVKVKAHVKDGVVVEKPVHLCFGISKEKFLQEIKMDFTVGKNASVDVFSHCVLIRRGKHIMDANILIENGGRYSYHEKHIHGSQGGLEVYPRARIEIREEGRFQADFELLRGRVGILDIDYEIFCQKKGIMDLTTRIKGSKNDVIRIKESGYLTGERSKGVLRSRVAVIGSASAEVYNKLVATAPHARGHIDCKEVIKDNATATAVPAVDVRHPKALITHEASIGSVDKKQLETLMSRGLNEDEATELIIEGLLS